MNIKKLNEEMKKTLNESAFIDEYTKTDMVGDAKVEVDFNYNFACGVAVHTDSFDIAWSQYDNSIGYANEKNEEEIKLPKRPNLVPTEVDLKETLAEINIPADFPITLFTQNILKVGKDIQDNYTAYWKEFKRNNM